MSLAQHPLILGQSQSAIHGKWLIVFYNTQEGTIYRGYSFAFFCLYLVSSATTFTVIAIIYLLTIKSKLTITWFFRGQDNNPVSAIQILDALPYSPVVVGHIKQLRDTASRCLSLIYLL